MIIENVLVENAGRSITARIRPGNSAGEESRGRIEFLPWIKTIEWPNAEVAIESSDSRVKVKKIEVGEIQIDSAVPVEAEIRVTGVAQKFDEHGEDQGVMPFDERLAVVFLPVTTEGRVVVVPTSPTTLVTRRLKA